MAKTKEKTRKRPGVTIPLAMVMGTVPGVMAVAEPMPFKDRVKTASAVFAGYDMYSKKWAWDNFKRGGLPVLLGIGVHLGASKLGANKLLARAKVPWLRI